ncbi:Hypothetical_protein [Hexamita inflata]|uniref:Hypothetical_protein n=1 Tax=Hexamita inflata TaxID=28002 RepID=A0AA86R3K9_9EUKA|nr:Hypothetical protein HINF_LOCUS57485 [Hexamita inflata]
MDIHKLSQQISLQLFQKNKYPKDLEAHRGFLSSYSTINYFKLVVSHSWAIDSFNQLDQRPYKIARLYLISELNWNSLFIWGGGMDLTGSGAIFSFVITIQHIL